MNEDSIKSFLSLLESLPPTPSVTFRGYVDTSITEPRAIASPVLTATSHNISIATNNLAVPQVAIFIGQNGRDLSTLMMGAPSFNLEEVTYMPGSYFYVHPAQELLGVTIQIYEEMRLTEGGKSLAPTRVLDSWTPILIEFEPALRAARSQRVDLPEGDTSIPMSRGAYVITLKDGSVHKVIVK